MSDSNRSPSSIPPSTERDPKRSIFEAVKDGRILDLFAEEVRDDVDGLLEGEDQGDYVSLTPTPPTSVVRDDEETEAMRQWRRRRGNQPPTKEEADQ